MGRTLGQPRLTGRHTRGAPPRAPKSRSARSSPSYPVDLDTAGSFSARPAYGQLRDIPHAQFRHRDTTIPLALATRTAPPSPRHRPAHSTTRVATSRHARMRASVTARHGHTTFHASRLSQILALSCVFKILKNKNTVRSISGACSTKYALNSSPDAVTCSTHPRFQLV